MKTARFALPLVLALSAGASFAEGPIQGNEVFNFQSSLSRAEVRAQAADAYRADQIARGEIGAVSDSTVASVRSRAEVRAEAAQAQREGRTARGDIVSVEAGA